MKIVPTRQDLLAENQKLKAQLRALQEKQAPVRVDPAKGQVTIKNYKPDTFTINHMTAHSAGITDLASGLSQVDKWVRPGYGSQLPDLNHGLAGKIEVESLRMTVPYETVNKMIPKLAGRQMSQLGVSEMSLSKGEGPGEIAIQGRARKFLVDVGFQASGRLRINAQGQPAFSLSQTRVAGMAMPNFLATLGAAVLAGPEMKELGVKQFGSEFTIDPSKLLPPNIQPNLTTVRVDEEGFVIEGGRDLEALTKKAQPGEG